VEKEKKNIRKKKKTKGKKETRNCCKDYSTVNTQARSCKD
jgi:hypothetical protein